MFCFFFTFVFSWLLPLTHPNVVHHAHVPGKACVRRRHTDRFADLHVQVTKRPRAAREQLHRQLMLRARASGNFKFAIQINFILLVLAVGFIFLFKESVHVDVAYLVSLYATLAPISLWAMME